MDFSDLSEKHIREIADYDAILRRGKEYYRQGRVESLNAAGSTAQAKVRGRNRYTVTIKTTNNGFDCKCTCPYEGPGCKHIVAVLYKILNETPKKSNNGNSKTSKLPKIDIKEIMNGAKPSAIIRAFEILRQKRGAILDASDPEFIEVEIKDNGEKHLVDIEPNDLFSWKEGYSSDCDCNYAEWEKCPHEIAALLLLSKTKKEKFCLYEERARKSLWKEKYDAFSKKLLLTDENNDAPRHDVCFDIRVENGDLLLKIQKKHVLKSGQIGNPSHLNQKTLEDLYPHLAGKKKRIVELAFSSLGDGPNSNYAQTYHATKKIGGLAATELLRALKELCTENIQDFSSCTLPNYTANMEFEVKEKNGGIYSFNPIANANGCSLPLSQRDIVARGQNSLWIAIKQKKNAETGNQNARGNMRSMIYYARENRISADCQALQNGEIVEIPCENPEKIETILSLAGSEFSEKYFKDFMEKHYLPISEFGAVKLPKKYEVTEIEGMPPKPRLFLRDHENSFCIEPRFLYGKTEANLYATRYLMFRGNSGKIVKISRDIEKEKSFIATLLEHNTLQNDGIFLPSKDPIAWLAQDAQKLALLGFEIYGHGNLTNNSLKMRKPKLVLDVSSGIDWFDLKADIDFGNQKIGIERLAQALSSGERFIRLDDGTTGVIPEKWVSKIGASLGFLHKEEGMLKASNAQTEIIETLINLSDKANVDDEYKKFREKFKRFREIKNVELPKDLKCPLREYQKAGYNWLCFLKEFGFGGCLADEMGLGKTAQVLALMLREQELGNTMPSLVVVPTSLVFNWLDEVKKFAPSLKVYVNHGTKRSLKKSKGANLILTTYGTLRQDFSKLAKKEFNYVILDESQNIKNPLAKNTKSAHTLKCRHKLALTGTPIENTSMDLWSQFAFLNPGLLGNIEHFRTMFCKSIEKDKDSEKAASLKTIVNPFMLMRKKELVAAELPDKQITNIYCEMPEDQKAFYGKWKQKIREDISVSMSENNAAKSRMKILAGLTRLRQICNHPLLVDDSYTGDSGKIALLLEEMEEIVKEGHKILVFSSFVKMLQIIKKEMDKLGIQYAYLDGKTTKRKEEIEKFQNNEKTMVFLISLKAGGLGLNLTAADYVFIVDPWWNPAAEMQAIDRAHRIGQEKKVFVYKVITKDTIEEKIIELQKSKLELVNSVIHVEESIFKKLSKNDITKMFE